MRVVDLSMTLREGVRGVEIRPARSLEADGFEATTLSLYSHAGTHMDAPRHFLQGERGIDATPLECCVGPAHVLDLRPVQRRERISVERLRPWEPLIRPGCRILLQTAWSDHADQPDYRTDLPSLSMDLAEWLVERRLALLGIDTPSVGDLNDPAHLAAVHETLLGGGVILVEDLAGLAQLRQTPVQFIALPLKVLDGDATPVRAVAIEDRPCGA